MKTLNILNKLAKTINSMLTIDSRNGVFTIKKRRANGVLEFKIEAASPKDCVEQLKLSKFVIDNKLTITNI
jgi:hypothetical protein